MVSAMYLFIGLGAAIAAIGAGYLLYPHLKSNPVEEREVKSSSALNEMIPELLEERGIKHERSNSFVKIQREIVQEWKRLDKASKVWAGRIKTTPERIQKVSEGLQTLESLQKNRGKDGENDQ